MLRLSFSPSRYLVGLLTLAHVLAAAAVWLVNGSIWFKVSVFLMIAASWAFHSFHDALLRSPYSVVAVLLKDDGSIEVSRRNGIVITGRQVLGSFVHPWFTTILWRGDD